MGTIKEPKGIDFVISSKPYTNADRKQQLAKQKLKKNIKQNTAMTTTVKKAKKTALNGLKKVATKTTKKKYNGAFADDGLGDTLLTLDWRKIKTVKPKYE